MATYTPDSLRNLFQSSFNLAQWYGFLQHFFNATALKSTPERIIENTSDEGYYLGNIDTTDSYRIGLFHYNIRQGSVANKRVGLRNLVKSFINPTWGEFDAALVVFDSGDHWRLSFICDIKGEATSPKRYTYVFGSDDLLYRTPIERFNFLKKKGVSFENLKTAFSVEALSDEFFDKYREQYADFIQYITGKRFVKAGSKWEEKVLGEPNATLMQAFDHNEKKIRDYVKKMMGRITFLHFLQRKGWMCSDLNYMQNMFENSSYKNDYLDSVLEPLFFGILNTKPAEREALFTDYGWDKSLLAEWKDIPYLNGGLFERDAEDEPESRFPADYFKRLFQFFSEYNFTIDENDPNDAEVGVDPEMLGKIFENLLEDNKDKGAFYTPKEIVRYMCQESLIAYLETNTSVAKDKIRQFVLSPEDGVADIPENKKPKLLTALEEVKICDPAIGSGAFPMGLLNELLHCREVLSGEHYDRAEIKKSIIQNNIYGVDIEKGAVDIARLRFWLSIVVDEETPSPLPNLDYKIMQGNSLIESFMGVDLSKLTYEKEYKKDKGEISLFDDEKNRLQKTVSHLLSSYYSCSDHDRKVKLQQEISDTINKQLEAQAYNPEILRELGAINLAENNKFFLWHTWFSDVFSRDDKEGFDIVIGNPPYVVTNKRDYPKYKWNSDLYKMFYELGIDVLMNFSSHLCFITPKFWMLNLEDEQMRKTFSCNLEIKQIAFCNPFETAVTENTVVLLSKNNNKQDEIEVFKYNPNSLCFENTIPLNLDYCSTNLHFEWVHGLNKQLINLLTKLVNNKKLKDISISKRGAEISKKVMRETIKGIPSLIGQDMKRYSILWCDTFIDAEHKEFYRLSSFFSNKLIYLRRVDTCLEATISTKPYGFNKNVYGIKVDEKFGYKIKFVLALLNSKLLDFYYKKKFSTKKEEAFPEIQTYLYEQLPLPIVNQEQQNKVISIVDTILQLKSGNNNADTSSLENEINVIVYDLYGLTDAEIKIIEQCI
jgi:type IIS restriction endonuclease